MGHKVHLPSRFQRRSVEDQTFFLGIKRIAAIPFKEYSLVKEADVEGPGEGQGE